MTCELNATARLKASAKKLLASQLITALVDRDLRLQVTRKALLTVKDSKSKMQLVTNEDDSTKVLVTPAARGEAVIVFTPEKLQALARQLAKLGKGSEIKLSIDGAKLDVTVETKE